MLWARVYAAVALLLCCRIHAASPQIDQLRPETIDDSHGDTQADTKNASRLPRSPVPLMNGRSVYARPKLMMVPYSSLLAALASQPLRTSGASLLQGSSPVLLVGSGLLPELAAGPARPATARMVLVEQDSAAEPCDDRRTTAFTQLLHPHQSSTDTQALLNLFSQLLPREGQLRQRDGRDGRRSHTGDGAGQDAAPLRLARRRGSSRLRRSSVRRQTRGKARTADNSENTRSSNADGNSGGPGQHESINQTKRKRSQKSGQRRSSPLGRASNGQTTTTQQQHLSLALGQVINKVGFEKYGQKLQQIIADLQPIKKAVHSAKHSMTHVQGSYARFESNLQALLEQTRSAQQILLFIMSSLFQENILLRRRLDECRSTEQLLQQQLQRQPDHSEKLQRLTEQLRSKMREYDTLLLTLVKLKASLEAERQELQLQRQRLSLRPPPPPGQRQFSLSTLLSLMMGLGRPSQQQLDVQLLLAQLFPDLYHGHPSLSTRPAADDGWYRLLMPIVGVKRQQEPPAAVVGQLELPQPEVRFSSPPHTQQLQQTLPQTPQTVPEADGEAFTTYMLDVLLRLYRAEADPQLERSLRRQMATVGRYVLC